MSKVTIGKSDAGKGVQLDIPRLIVSRLLVTADSGGGKSYILRKILEEVSKSTQTIVIDPEGEFSTLREKRDMVLAGPDGEVPAEPRSAALLCRRLMELHLSAVIDLSELDLAGRRAFCASFLTTMVDLPRKLWHPCFVAIDELHEFAPEDEKSESGSAVAMLSSKGRKRGFCTIGATQRLGKLSKNAAAGLKNQLYGTFSLDTDIKRAAGALGFGKDRWVEIRDLSSQRGKEGEFFAFGPAFNHRGVLKMRALEVETTHPEPGTGRARKPPAPSAKIKGVLAELKDIPAEAQAEIKHLAAARSRIVELERQMRIAARAQPATAAAAAAPPRELQAQLKQSAAAIAALRKGLSDAMKVIAEIKTAGCDGKVDSKVIRKALDAAAEQIAKDVDRQLAPRQATFESLRKHATVLLDQCQRLLSQDVNVTLNVKHNEPFTIKPTPAAAPPRRPRAPSSDPASGDGMPKGERAMLTAVAQYPDGADRTQLTVLTGYKRSTRDRLLQYLGAKGFVTPNGDLVTATEEGLAALGDFEPLPTGAALLNYWLEKLPQGERKLLEVIAGAYPSAIERSTIDDAAGYKRSTRDRIIQYLQARKLVSDAGKGKVIASAILFD